MTKRILFSYFAIFMIVFGLLAVPFDTVQADPIVRWVTVDNASHTVTNTYATYLNSNTVCGANYAIRGVRLRRNISTSGTYQHYAWSGSYTFLNQVTSNGSNTWGWSRTNDTDVSSTDPISSSYTYSTEINTGFTNGSTYADTVSLTVDRFSGGTFTIFSEIYIACSNTLPTSTPTTAPTNTTTPTTAATATASPTPQQTVTAGNQVCQVGHTLKAFYAVWDYEMETVGSGYVETYYLGQDGISPPLTQVIDSPSGRVVACIKKNDGVSDDKCGKMTLLTGYSATHEFNSEASGPEPNTGFKFAVWHVASASVSVQEYGYLCYNSSLSQYYLVRNMGGPSHSFGASGGVKLEYTADTPTIQLECKPESVVQNFDLVDLGSVTAGSLTAASGGNLSVTLQYTIPVPVFGSPGYASASLAINVDAQNSYLPLPSVGTTQINGLVYNNDDLTEIGLVPGTTQITVQYQQAYDPDMMPVVLSSMILSVHVENPRGNGLLNCDGGMELEVPETPWDKTTPELEFGRLVFNISNWISPLEGAPACEQGMHVVGTHPPALAFFGAPEASHAFEYFSAPGGTVYWKLRYRSNDLLNNKNSPHVYLTDKTTGALVSDLLGLPGSFDQTLVQNDWTLVTGSIELTSGNYGVFLSAALRTTAVYYDDLYFSTRPWDNTDCTEEFTFPEEVTPGPSPTPTTTTTMTPTGEIPGGTATVTATLVASATITRTSWPSLTPRPSYTPGATMTLRATVTRTITPNVTSVYTITPTYGQPNPNTPTPGNTTPDPDMPPNNTPGPPIGDIQVDCQRPTNWFSLAWWLDYERCAIVSFVSFGPSQRATAAAIPSIFTEYEPFGTVKEFTDGMVSVRTQVAGYPWNASGAASGVNDSINPLQPLKGGTCADPWNGDLGLGRPCNSVIASWNDGCSAHIASYMPGALARGLCFVFGVTRNIGVLPWIQFFINLTAILMPIRLAFTIIEMRQNVAGMVSAVSSTQEN